MEGFYYGTLFDSPQTVLKFAYGLFYGKSAFDQPGFWFSGDWKYWGKSKKFVLPPEWMEWRQMWQEAQDDGEGLL